ncbi:hypothetical protein B6S59_01200 [Pseudomonas sp. A46]|nr:hypothetical protein [Pseudomonas sp. A46]OWJ98298.1 hypothetical protein B6S59_01200 [Pseudomonas sp. A46]
MTEKDLEQIETLCDVCGESPLLGKGTPQFGSLNAKWESGSTHAGEQYEIRLCETCFFRTLAGLRRERMVSSLFDEDDPDLSRFEPVAR